MKAIIAFVVTGFLCGTIFNSEQAALIGGVVGAAIYLTYAYKSKTIDLAADVSARAVATKDEFKDAFKEKLEQHKK